MKLTILYWTEQPINIPESNHRRWSSSHGNGVKICVNPYNLPGGIAGLPSNEDNNNKNNNKKNEFV